MASFVNVVDDYGAVADGDVSDGSGTDNTAAFQAAFATGRAVYIPQGVYRLHDAELTLRRPGQVIFGDGCGEGESLESGAVEYQHNTTLLFTGEGGRRIRTRRSPRLTSGDPQDAPISVALDVEAEGVFLRDFTIALFCDYTDDSHTNLGDDYDVGLFIGCRARVKDQNLHIIGYWRVADEYVDVTRGSNLPEFSDPDSIPFDYGTVRNGGDGRLSINPLRRGGKWGLFLAGAVPTGASDYYDQAAGLVTDTRGMFGASDFTIFGGRILAPTHHSGRRMHDPVSPLDVSGEGLAAGAMYMDGQAGNSSGSVWRIKFYGTRFMGWEAFRVRLGRCANVQFYGTVFDRGGNSVVMNTSGTVIDQDDEENHSYGVISSEADTNRVLLLGTTGTPNESHFLATDVHYFGQGTTAESGSFDYVNIGGGGIETSSVGAMSLSGTAPFVRMYETDADSNEKIWRAGYITNGDYYMGTRKDDNSGGMTFYRATRSSENITKQEWTVTGSGAEFAFSGGAIKPPTLADSAASSGTLYYSSTQSKLVFKDAGGTVHSLW